MAAFWESFHNLSHYFLPKSGYLRIPTKGMSEGIQGVCGNANILYIILLLGLYTGHRLLSMYLDGL